MQYLGHIISEEGIAPVPEKIRKYTEHIATTKPQGGKNNS